MVGLVWFWGDICIHSQAASVSIEEKIGNFSFIQHCTAKLRTLYEDLHNKHRSKLFISLSICYPLPFLTGSCTERIVGPSPVAVWMMKPLSICSTVLSCFFCKEWLHHWVQFLFPIHPSIHAFYSAHPIQGCKTCKLHTGRPKIIQSQDLLAVRQQCQALISTSSYLHLLIASYLQYSRCEFTLRR